MKIVIPDDYQDCIRTLDAGALVLIRARTPITAELLAQSRT